MKKKKIIIIKNNAKRVVKKLENKKSNKKNIINNNENIPFINNNNNTPVDDVLNNADLLSTLKPCRPNTRNNNNNINENDYNTPTTNNNILQYNTRSAPPVTCYDFGVNRVTKYPHIFFCAECSQYDELLIHKPTYRNNAKARPSRYYCTANHTSRDQPTVTIAERTNYRNKKIIMNDGTNYTNCAQYSELNSEYNNEKNIVVNNDSNKNKRTERNDDIPESCEAHGIVIVNDNDIILYDVNNDDNYMEVQTNLCQVFDNITETNNTSVESVGKFDENMIESCERRIDVGNNDTILENDGDDMTYDLLYSKYIDVCFNNVNLIEDKQILEHRLMNIQLENVSLKSAVNELKMTKVELTKLNVKHNKLKESKETTSKLISEDNLEYLIQQNTKLDSFLYNILPALEKLSKQKNRLADNSSKTLVEILWSSTIWDGKIRLAMIDKVKKYYRSDIFSPAKLCELLDMAGGQLSYEGIDLLRSLETNGEKYVRDTMIPHPSSIKRVCLNVDKYANYMVPFKMDKMDDGSEFAEFSPKDIILQMYKAYDLETIAEERPICIDQSIDAAQITNRQKITVHGLKMIDVAARNPKTGKLLYVDKDNCSIQSRNNCWVTKIAACGETKVSFAQFRPIMQEVKDLTMIPINNYKPIMSCMDCDLSATWKLLMSGGAMRNKKFACHLCAEKDTCVGEHNAIRCERFCEILHHDNDTIKCRHKEIFSTNNIDAMRYQFQNLKEEIIDLEHKMEGLLENSIMNCEEDPRAPTNPDKELSITSIHFNIKNKLNDVKKREIYSQYVNNDLDLRELDLLGNLEERQARLKHSLISEYRFREIKVNLEVYDEKDDERFLNLLECVPCILHMENRCGIKILFMLLVEGLNNAGAQVTFKEISLKVDRIMKFKELVETLVNTTVFGNEDQPACWNLPLDKGQNQMYSITMDNNRSRSIVLNLNGLIDICVRGDNIEGLNRRQLFYDCISHYNQMFVMIRKKDDFTDEEILEYQKLADYFYHEWIQLYGREGITNYIHMIGSGHVADFLYQYRNLYRHSQQGWEHLNSFLKVYFFRRTMRGGGNNGGSKIKPLAKWLARRMVWMSGTTYENMLEYIRLKENTDLETNDVDDEDFIFETDEDSFLIHENNPSQVL